MKKIAVLICLLLFIACLSVKACGTDHTVNDAFREEFDTLIDAMPKEVQRDFGDILYTPEGISEMEGITRVSSVRRMLSDALNTVFPSVLDFFVRMFLLIVCAGIFHSVKDTFYTPALSGAFSFCSTLVFALTLGDSVDALLSSTLSYLQTVSTLSAAAAPITAAVTAASGQLTAAAVSHTSLMLLFTLMQNIGTALLLPLVRISYCLGIAASLGSFVRIGGIAKCVRRVFTVSLAFLTVVIGFVLGTQTLLTKSADSFTLKTVKFALGNMIPMVGGAVSEAVSTVSGSLSLIRSVAGGLCVLSLLIIVLPVLTQLLLYRLALSICQGGAEMLGCEQEGKLIGEVHGLLGSMIAVVSLTSILFIFVLTLITLIGGNH